MAHIFICFKENCTHIRLCSYYNMNTVVYKCFYWCKKFKQMRASWTPTMQFFLSCPQQCKNYQEKFWIPIFWWSLVFGRVQKLHLQYYHAMDLQLTMHSHCAWGVKHMCSLCSTQPIRRATAATMANHMLPPSNATTNHKLPLSNTTANRSLPLSNATANHAQPCKAASHSQHWCGLVLMADCGAHPHAGTAS